MAVRNPSELQRLQEELEYAKSIVKNPTNGKSTKEKWLREVRVLERTLGLQGENYNGGKF